MRSLGCSAACAPNRSRSSSTDPAGSQRSMPDRAVKMNTRAISTQFSTRGERSINMKVKKFQWRRALGNLFGAFAVFALASLPMLGNDGAPSARQVFDRQLSATEREVMGVAEAMPANKFNFVPTDGAFKNVRTFGVQ